MKSQKSANSTQKLTNQLSAKAESQGKQSVRAFGQYKQSSEHGISNKITQEINLPITEQWNEISKIQQENAILRDEIEVEDRNSNVKDAQYGLQMEKLQEQCSNFAKKIEIENQRMEDNQKEINSLQQQLLEKKKILESSDANELPQILKQIKNYELKFDQIRITLNESLAEIKKLKEECNQKRRERVIFDNVFKKLEQDLQKKEMELKEQLQQSIQSEKSYELAKEEFKKIKKQAETEIKNFGEQYQKAFSMEISQQQQNFLDINDSQLLEQDQDEEDSPQTFKKKINQKKQQQNKDQQLQDEQQMSEEIEIIFEKLQAMINCETIEDFIEDFKNVKQLNLDLFDETNQISLEIDNLEKQTQDMYDEMSKYAKQLPRSQPEEVENEDMANLKEQEKEVELKIQQTEKENQELTQNIENIINQLPNLVNEIGCTIDYQPITEEDPITYQNVIPYLVQVEKKINEIIELQNFLEKKDYQKFVQKKKQSQKKNEDQSLTTESKEIPPTLLNLLTNAKKLQENEKIKTDQEFKLEGLSKISDLTNLEQKRKKT